MENYKLPKLYDADNDLNQRWFVFYSFRHPETGKMKRFRIFISTKYKTATARREKASELIKYYSTRLKQNWNPFEQEQIQLISASAAMEKILEIKKASIRPRSYFTLKNIVKSFREYLIAHKLERISINDFGSRHAIEFLDWSKSHYKLSNRTVNYRRMNMKTLFNELIYREYVDVNPFSRTKKLPVEETSIIAYSASELKKISEKLHEYNFNLYIISMMVFYCFIRPQEICRLKISDIDLEAQVIHLPGRTSKNKKSEVVVIPDQLKEEMEKLNLKFPGDYYFCGKGLVPGPQYTAPTRIAEAWSAWAKAVKMKNRGIYALKHTSVGMVAMEGKINIRDLQLQLRHHSLDMTQNYLDRFSSIASKRLKSSFPEM
ncbi:MAG TPA: site-specific integrase [Paludibacteraceae bacterium]|nr:site-specific integrase [Paludibacteraceae bacterium]